MGIILGLLLVCVGPVSAGNDFTVSYDGDYTILTFDNVGNWSWTDPNGISTIDYLIVAGGGGGGSNPGTGGPGGGGAGGMLNATNYSVTAGGLYNITVGAGGTATGSSSGTSGTNSSFAGLIALGGGAGVLTGDGIAGGSGGGAASIYSYSVYPAGGAGLAGQGNAGGYGGNRWNNYMAGGAGGGAGAAGNGAGGAGGVGRINSITGCVTFYAGGGAGTSFGSAGGTGGGGAEGVNGTNGYGGGGGGKFGGTGGYGGSGVVIIKYLTPVLPVANFTSNVTMIVESLPVAFNDTSTGSPISWNWSFGDGIYSSIQNPVHAYTTVGIYTVALNATNSYGSNTTTKINYINVIPPVAALFSSNTTSGVDPIAVQFNDSSTGSPIAWNWSFKNVTGNNTQVWFSISQNPTYIFGVGNYSIVLNASNSAGYNLSTQVTFINVSAAPIVPAAPLADFTGIPLIGNVPLGVTFTDNSTGTSILERRWDFGDGNISTYSVPTNPFHIFTSIGVKNVTLTVTNASGASMRLRINYINVLAVPVTNVAGNVGVFRSVNGNLVLGYYQYRFCK